MASMLWELCLKQRILSTIIKQLNNLEFSISLLRYSFTYQSFCLSIRNFRSLELLYSLKFQSLCLYRSRQKSVKNVGCIGSPKGMDNFCAQMNCDKRFEARDKVKIWSTLKKLLKCIYFLCHFKQKKELLWNKFGNKSRW